MNFIQKISIKIPLLGNSNISYKIKTNKMCSLPTKRSNNRDIILYKIIKKLLS